MNNKIEIIIKQFVILFEIVNNYGYIISKGRCFMVNFEDFMKLDIRVGEIIKVESFEKAKSLLISY